MPPQVKNACDAVRKAWGAVDILVNNAGILSNNKIADTTPEEWRRIHAVNLDGAYLLCRELRACHARAALGHGSSTSARSP